MNFLAHVHALIDARLAALGIECSYDDLPCCEYDDLPCGECCDLPGFDGTPVVAKSHLFCAVECCAAPPRELFRRLPENLPVPSVEPHPPDLKAVNLSFAARVVIAVRDKFAGDAPRVYTAARISRQAYSQIVSDETRPVSKRTAIRFAFALHSTPTEAQLLLKSAGYAFSNAQAEDVVLQVCLEVNPPIFDLALVNQLLQEYRVDFQY